MTSLQRKWEAILKQDGMPAEPVRPYGQALTNANTDLACASYSDSPRLERWTRLTHAVNNLPVDFHNRQLLVTLCETGYATKTARQHRVSTRTVFRAIKALERYMQDVE